MVFIHNECGIPDIAPIVYEYHFMPVGGAQIEVGEAAGAQKENFLGEKKSWCFFFKSGCFFVTSWCFCGCFCGNSRCFFAKSCFSSSRPAFSRSRLLQGNGVHILSKKQDCVLILIKKTEPSQI